MWQLHEFRRPGRHGRAPAAITLVVASLGAASIGAAQVKTFGPEGQPSKARESVSEPAVKTVESPTRTTQPPRDTPDPETPPVRFDVPQQTTTTSYGGNPLLVNEPIRRRNEAGAPAAGVVSLQAGDGFAGPSPAPARVGPAGVPGADAMAIAHWNVVPNQIFSGHFDVGVVAFHINDIDRVEFSLNGGPWSRVREMSLNRGSDTWEYWARLDARSIPDGPVEVRAIAYPKSGMPRLLEPLTLYTNAGGSVPQHIRYVSPSGNNENGDGSAQNPFATIYKAADSIRNAPGSNRDASFGTIYLLAGDHLYAGRVPGNTSIDANRGWLTIAAAPGADRNRVRIIGNNSSTGGLNAKFVRFQNITITSTSLVSPSNAGAACWFDGCELAGSGPSDTAKFASNTSWTGGVYATGGVMRDVRTGLVHAMLQRGMLLENFGSDTFHNPRLVINCEVNMIKKPAGTNYHPDLIQFNGAFDNVIIYGLKAREIHAQGIFSRGSDGIPDRNLAFVNVLVDQRSHLSQWLQAADHVLFKNVMILGRAFNISNDAGRDPTVLTNALFEGCVFHEMRCDPRIVAPENAQVFRNNHFINGRPMGGSFTTGDPRLLSPPDGRFEPRPDSPLARRINHHEIPADILGRQRLVPSAIGPYEVANAQ